MMRSTIEGDMDKRKCPKCASILQKLWDREDRIRYFCNRCEKVMVYHKDTEAMEIQNARDIQDNR